MLEKNYNAADVEERLYRRWESTNAFACNPGSDARPYTIMMPPPNVTGSLHMGHALTFTLQDILIRYYRMNGRDTLWQPGTDHAGIATQMVVERQLGESGISRHDLGRDSFIDRVWEWKAESGGTITRQLRSLGCSPDWGRERFTMDEGLSDAVRKVFVKLHRDGLMYRDKRLVNWDPILHTAISDLEVENRETVGKMWHLRYPVLGEEGRFLVVATTRPETMLGDMAVAVNPEDERYRDLIGKQVMLPLAGRPIPIIADEYADPEKGSGAVKITPAHDFNDFEVGKRHNLELLNILDADARLNDAVPEAYRGLDRFVARERILQDLEALDLVERIEENPMVQPYGDRSGVIIEPWLTDQWFVDAKTLCEAPVRAVEEGRTRFVPKQWEKTFFEWMRNIQPWCVSRQIWWGHQIPAWYGPDGHIFVEETEEEAIAAARAHYGSDVSLTRDTDVLDTWFSSALWPFSTLGWPESTPELARYYPGDVLVTGFDIIFFWVARMMMMGHYIMGDVPFRDVYIHALVRDEKGQKMSKSKGNVIDPLELTGTYGTDALRFTLAAMAAPGRDIKMSESRVAGYRNFVTKLWNAARFCQMNECVPVAGFDPDSVRLTFSRWIVAKTRQCATQVGEAFHAYRFNDAAQIAYSFVWNTFCDWYLEMAKPLLQNADGIDPADRSETRAVTAWALDQILHILHPMVPFVTEELWNEIAPRERLLISEPWPAGGSGSQADADAEDTMDWVVSLITSVRSIRAEMNVPPGAQIPLLVRDADALTRERLATWDILLKRLGRLSSIAITEAPPARGSAQAVLGEATLVLPLEGVIDLDQERARLEKEIRRMTDEVARIDKKLGNPGFVAKAPAEVIEEQREKRADYESTRQKLEDALARIA
ncbi:valine--tRNA ligase [Phaeovibrio sulfidiphilus]|uniref:Valine--tRNA ligase n=1 Tax=Phaeovibrio sulfidiphilus TaxID=1220600 RepID=A0A8J6YPB7_9PROT|nr:valine--tRNA ligase [Phaeovibrio sulfidiphilus]MBE1237091.1 valine--tRNA ligase [Phaeovibrio sulfidiphilus]